MRIAITGGTGFVGRHLARSLVRDGHEVVLIARSVDRRDERVRALATARFCPIGLDDVDKLVAAFADCDGVAHCAGINRELSKQTYRRVHVEGTRNVVAAAQRAGVRRIALLSFLRARPDCGSGYHESKWAAEEIVRGSGLDHTILKAGAIYGRGDHLLDHLSHALITFPVFGLVGMKDRPVRPTAVEDVVRILRAALIDGRLVDRTVAVTGPEELLLRELVARVGAVVGRRPIMIRLPVMLQRVLARLFELTMTVPLISTAQVRILAEGVADPLTGTGLLPADLRPTRTFTHEQIRRGLPDPEPFGLRDCRWSTKSFGRMCD
jgi:NADH dehydrogenase